MYFIYYYESSSFTARHEKSIVLTYDNIDTVNRRSSIWWLFELRRTQILLMRVSSCLGLTVASSRIYYLRNKHSTTQGSSFDTSSSSSFPPGCYYRSGDKFYFNTQSSTALCTVQRNCVCKPCKSKTFLSTYLSKGQSCTLIRANL